MNEALVRDGMRVVIVSDRPVSGRSWKGAVSVVFTTAMRGLEAFGAEWVLVRQPGTPNDGFPQCLAYRPDELDAVDM
jgi:hypothetical protein